ncbi:uncharacterized protein CANTADRAFT_22007 [Suhomyces tanzawaensis NRRL Y-17324]|uniref:Uncharacterized protein n=1 Tax=Suhomyces tanzawaensis NRRL Y-17324 TaxID=984487 RepID=A0A1E4SIE8_9ASCO|nr:uncharacterized protein CANTADRAFT_22007 [Suhomyces tanzawaensis NRRL Y-17324]ODV79250.1 hypothetical protein CANTADRAFT_22007 [Suhomyces tanzawaensis NRRL Y-17324]
MAQTSDLPVKNVTTVLSNDNITGVGFVSPEAGAARGKTINNLLGDPREEFKPESKLESELADMPAGSDTSDDDTLVLEEMLVLTRQVTSEIEWDAKFDAETRYRAYFKHLPPFDEYDLKVVGKWKYVLENLFLYDEGYKWLIKNYGKETPSPNIEMARYKGRDAEIYFSRFDFHLERAVTAVRLIVPDYTRKRFRSFLTWLNLVIQKKADAILRYQVKLYFKWRMNRTLSKNYASSSDAQEELMDDVVPRELSTFLLSKNKFGAYDIYLNPPKGKYAERAVMDEIVTSYKEFCNFTPYIQEIMTDLNIPESSMKLTQEAMILAIRMYADMSQNLHANHDEINYNGFIHWERAPKRKRANKGNHKRKPQK